jgi:hypothetical protein
MYEESEHFSGRPSAKWWNRRVGAADRRAESHFELAKVAYEQTLKATEYANEKAGRVITAVAFLVAAAITLVVSQGLYVERWIFGTYKVPLIEIGLWLFLAPASVALMLLLKMFTTGDVGPKGKKSSIYFADIAELDFTTYKQDVESASLATLADCYILGAYSLSGTMAKKRRHFNLAVKFLKVSVVFFAVLSALGCNALASSRSSHNVLIAQPSHDGLANITVLILVVVLAFLGLFYSSIDKHGFLE